MKILAVRFPNESSYEHQRNKRYHYFYTGDIDVKPGMWAVVDVTGTYKLVEIKEVTGDDTRHLATKPIVQIVDDSQYKTDLENARKRVDILKELEAMRKRAEEQDRYKILAGNPEADALLAQLSSLNAGSTRTAIALEAQVTS